MKKNSETGCRPVQMLQARNIALYFRAKRLRTGCKCIALAPDRLR